MENITNLNIKGHECSVNFKLEPNGYHCIIFQVDGSTCDNWFEIDMEIVQILCQTAIDYVLTNLPEKFYFFTQNQELYQIYKERELNFIDFYNVKEQSGSDLIHKISIYYKKQDFINEEL
jgi:hypothetical protein